MTTSTPCLHDFTVNDINGKAVSLSEYKGKTVLLVNVASFCGYTPQYEQLQALYTKYKDEGLVVLAFPANDFGAQEPGTNSEIKEFCTHNYGVTFPLFEKITVKGTGIHPLYIWLVSGGGGKEFGGEIPWNFEKFLINGKGQIVARFNYRTPPDDQQVLLAITAQLREK